MKSLLSDLDINLKGDPLVTAVKSNGVYEVALQEEARSDCAMSATVHSESFWHRRLGHLHLNNHDLRSLRSLVDGENDQLEDVTHCEVCVKERQSWKPFPKQSFSKSSEKLQLILDSYRFVRPYE